MPNRQKKFVRSRTRALAQPQKSASAQKRGKKKFVSNPLMMGIKKRKILRRFQKYKLVL
jgi:hypothetical protein